MGRGLGDPSPRPRPLSSPGQSLSRHCRHALVTLHQVDPLMQLSSAMRTSLCERAKYTHFDVGELICREGADADSFYVVLSGTVQVMLALAAPWLLLGCSPWLLTT